MILHQVAQRAVDLNRAVDCYRTLLGADPIAVFDPPGLAFFSLGETRLLLERGAPSALIYLRVDDVRTRLVALREAGFTVESEPHVIFSDTQGTFGAAGEDEWMAFVRDSEDNIVGLASRNRPEDD